MVGGGLWGLETLTLSLLLPTILGVEPAPVAQAQVAGGQALGFRGPSAGVCNPANKAAGEQR